MKPLRLLRWLTRLVTPPGGLCIDPFAGSGSTGCAAAIEGFNFQGAELHDEADTDPPQPFVRIARARIGWWATHYDEADAVCVGDAEEPAPGRAQETPHDLERRPRP